MFENNKKCLVFEIKSNKLLSLLLILWLKENLNFAYYTVTNTKLKPGKMEMQIVKSSEFFKSATPLGEQYNDILSCLIYLALRCNLSFEELRKKKKKNGFRVTYGDS